MMVVAMDAEMSHAFFGYFFSLYSADKCDKVYRTPELQMVWPRGTHAAEITGVLPPRYRPDRVHDMEGRRDTDSNVENPAVEAPPPPPAYSTTDCTICLGEFAFRDAISVMPTCSHSLHASCIERWLAGGHGSSCPTCRAPAADEATNSGANDCSVGVSFLIMLALQFLAMALYLIDTTVRYFR